MKVYHNLKFLFEVYTTNVGMNLFKDNNSWTVVDVCNDQAHVVKYVGARLKNNIGLVIHRPTVEHFKSFAEMYSINLYTDSPQYVKDGDVQYYLTIESFK